MKVVVAAALLVVAVSAGAQTAFPTRQVTVIVPFPPGGGTDTGARIVAQ
jgi:tripartite-type tricarboxylate transporter receptor subunit TctC